MVRRHALSIVCSSLAIVLVVVCGLVVVNFMRLAEAQTFATDFATAAVNLGPDMRQPEIAPLAARLLPRDRMMAQLRQAHRVGPLEALSGTSCLVQADPHNLCGGQLMMCDVSGVGQGGRFEARIAMCRGGNLASYRLAGSAWAVQSDDGAPITDDEANSQI